MTARACLMITATVAVLSACSFSGLDAQSKFACKAPDGVVCDSMTGSLANLQAGNVRSTRTSQAAANAPTSKTPAQGAVLARPLFSGSPIRSAPHVVRAWIAPWEDADGDLHDQSYLYLTTDTGRWLVEHNQRRIRDLYRPAVGGTVAAAASASPKAEPPASAVALGTGGAVQTAQGELLKSARDVMDSAQQAVRQAPMSGDLLKNLATGIRSPQ
ncbi:type IV conjugative transfer system protein TraV [Burkholderia stagnalis]|uniref:type IV conjugative transfer system lipoprotein TraV n=1 Tax=Burkholderia stagnalis TaxID=1503054 RepID=UPI000F5EE6BB|nr:type IV conjugative transfer system lipoprotein TraV [Burkholderia stagnalis]RQX95006.1 type IV conjugative transfer system protein TraV [Burkholderia stagnalis]RQY32559.1 type IV conjugative transfer system protein TraV [Burkholderia stagnalis]RQY49627.1 type IV conjugative transfer system protein TraV [Burkholderia stagnalis]RQY56571.1 type IV conjugative transfer system protein TraV [Burkholderia stagnalis]RQY86343.1 type IV conjugative transfer system protein TraV [Burkholderia stagnali